MMSGLEYYLQHLQRKNSTTVYENTITTCISKYCQDIQTSTCVFPNNIITSISERLLHTAITVRYSSVYSVLTGADQC